MTSRIISVNKGDCALGNGTRQSATFEVMVGGDGFQDMLEAFENGDDITEFLPKKAFIECAYCGQFSLRRTACRYCGAPPAG